jgi:Bacterial Ig-like domain (group 3)
MAAAHSYLRQSPFRLYAILALLAAFTLLAGAHRAAADAAHPATTTTLTASPASVVAGQPVTLTATVTGTGGAPVGIVDFWNNTSSGRVQLDVVDGPVWLVPTGPNTSQATWTWIPAFGNYTVTASYTSTDTTNFQGSVSNAVAVSTTSASPHNTNLVLTADPTTIQTGGTVTFKAVVTETDGPGIPTGTVSFTASDNLNPSTQTTLGQVTLDANGVATLPDVGGWAFAANYTIDAKYSGDVNDNPVGSELILPVTAAPDTSVHTDTQVTATPSQIEAGDTVTLVAHVTQIGNPTPPPAGDNVTFRSTSIFGDSVLLDSVPLQADGTATITVTFAQAADYTIQATYVGDIFQHILGSSGTVTISVNGPRPTTITYTGATQVNQGDNATLSARLTDTSSSSPIAGEPVTLTVAGGTETCTATTDASGVASCNVVVTDAAGGQPVHAVFAGDANHLASNATGTLDVVTAVPTTLTYSGDTSANGGGPATIAFLLQDASANPVAGQSVSLTIDGHPYTATTGANGVASTAILAPSGAGSYAVSGSFGGATGYLASTGSGSLQVTTVPTKTTYNGDTQTVVGASVTLAATLVDAGTNAPLAGRSLTLHFGNETCTASTDASGHASCTVTVTDAPGSYTVTATFAGDAGHIGSVGTGTIVVGQAATTVTDNVSGTFLVGSTLTLSGTLSANGGPLAGKTLALSFGTAGCTGVTGANGVATCTTTVPGPTGPATTAASFAGDVSYKPSSDSKSALVYGLAPGGGSFVVGDGTATGSVTFWGSQWWKKNVLSAGNAQAVDPGAFKGFAASPSSPQCGGTWSTAPGNSTPPPAGPLPAYMAVIVTSRNAKAPGRVITGDIVHVVVVKTDAGYDGNPGHAGTGTVVATIC